MGKLWILLAGLPLAGCVSFLSDYDEDGNLRNVSPAAMAALPRGIDPDFLIRDEAGCYGIALEQGEGAQGIALLNNAGVQVCDA